MYKLILYSEAGRGGRLVSASDCYVGVLPIESGILPLLKQACGEAIGCPSGRQGVAPEMNFR